MTERSISESYAWCERVARRQAGHFYPAFRLLPRSQRLAMCALYAFLRVADDITDGPDALDDKRRALLAWREQLHAAAAGQFHHRLHPALADAVHRFSIPLRFFDDALDGMEMDLSPVRFTTFDELYVYCYRVAAAVGLASVHVWGYSNPAALKSAEHAGIALQLTNILRDLGEDAARGRLYLPTDDLARFDCPADRLGDVADGRYRNLMAFEVARARGYYRQAEALPRYLSPPGRAAFHVIVTMYRRLLDEIERCGYDVCSRRVRLSRWAKLRVVLRALPARWGLRL